MTAPAHNVAELIADMLKAIVGAVREYDVLLTKAVNAALNGRMDKAALRNRHKALIRDLAPQAYYDGMKAGGIDDPEAALEPEDEATIKEWTAEQLTHVNDFADAVVSAAKQPDLESGIIARVALWIGSMENLQSLGKASALKNMMVTWRMGATEQHCTSCKRLNGKRRRLSWFIKNGYIPRENASETLECGGWECLCGLFDDKGKQVLP